MDKFNKYINEKVASDKGIEKDWVYNSLTVSNTKYTELHRRYFLFTFIARAYFAQNNIILTVNNVLSASLKTIFLFLFLLTGEPE